MKRHRKEYFSRVRRVVVKVGSGVLTKDSGLNLNVVESISSQISQLMDQGMEVILVSSGAMAAGLRKMGFSRRPDEIPQRQAIAAIGQAGLILEYEKMFARFGRKVAQILLTANDLSNRVRYLNVRNTLNTLVSWKVLPIINENDTVVTDEIKVGDNDNLSAVIALLLDADILINLTDIDGLFTKNPKTDPEAELISEVPEIDKNIESIATGLPGVLGTGGMMSKVTAARKTVAASIPMIIANGARQNILLDLFDGKDLGTFFIPGKERLNSRKCWIAFNLKPKGKLVIDDGASRALSGQGKSLLPIGIKSVTGSFSVGDPVEFWDMSGNRLGVGLVNYSSADIDKIKGLNSSKISQFLGSKPYDEVIHRDNLAFTFKAD
ncbi:MAG: glutamate 5-kinase [Proteobacteria bacterium]|nr:glutamate 5-kinase [Pseudomonadota bacterium]